MTDTFGQDEQRQAAIKRIKARQGFYQHLVVYTVINALLIVIWATTGAKYFWPGWVLAGWGVGVILNAWEVFSAPITEEKIQREIHRQWPA